MGGSAGSASTEETKMIPSDINAETRAAMIKAAKSVIQAQPELKNNSKLRHPAQTESSKGRFWPSSRQCWIAEEVLGNIDLEDANLEKLITISQEDWKGLIRAMTRIIPAKL
jgi:hypothetical protein